MQATVKRHFVSSGSWSAGVGSLLIRGATIFPPFSSPTKLWCSRTSCLCPVHPFCVIVHQDSFPLSSRIMHRATYNCVILYAFTTLHFPFESLFFHCLFFFSARVHDSQSQGGLLYCFANGIPFYSSMLWNGRREAVHKMGRKPRQERAFH